MAEHRDFAVSICVKIDAKTVAKFEAFPATQWAFGRLGEFRVRRNRKWVGDSNGKKHFFTPQAIAQFVTKAAFGIEEACQPPRPNLPRRSWVLVSSYETKPIHQRVRTATDPIQGQDGRWYVAIGLYGHGTVMVPVDELTILKLAPKE